MDRDLVELAQAGDRAAYVDLIRGRSDRLFAVPIVESLDYR